MKVSGGDANSKPGAVNHPVGNHQLGARLSVQIVKEKSDPTATGY